MNQKSKNNTGELKELAQLPCYVVIEEDRGMGATVEAVYMDNRQAVEHAKKSSHLYIEKSLLHNVKRRDDANEIK